MIYYLLLFSNIYYLLLLLLFRLRRNSCVDVNKVWKRCSSLIRGVILLCFHIDLQRQVYVVRSYRPIPENNLHAIPYMTLWSLNIVRMYFCSIHFWTYFDILSRLQIFNWLLYNNIIHSWNVFDRYTSLEISCKSPPPLALSSGWEALHLE